MQPEAKCAKQKTVVLGGAEVAPYPRRRTTTKDTQHSLQ